MQRGRTRNIGKVFMIMIPILCFRALLRMKPLSNALKVNENAIWQNFMLQETQAGSVDMEPQSSSPRTRRHRPLVIRNAEMLYFRQGEVAPITRLHFRPLRKAKTPPLGKVAKMLHFRQEEVALITRSHLRPLRKANAPLLGKVDKALSVL